jgi:hypothetical protein
MKLKFAVFWVIALFALFAKGQELSTKAEVSLITCGPGQDLYATFGHSALQVYDPVNGIDKVYNYGTFDFNTPNFYLKFARGKLNYILNVSTFERFLYTYHVEGRWVVRQELELSPEQKEELYTFLEWNAKPENRDYQYDFFYDNCSTRIRDALLKILGEDLYFPELESDTTATFREMIDLYLTNHAWSDLGIDLALGMPCDEEAGFYEKMFLPDYLMAHFTGAKLELNGNRVPLIKSESLVLAENTAINPSGESHITWVFWVIFIIAGIIISLIYKPADKAQS